MLRKGLQNEKLAFYGKAGQKLQLATEIPFQA